MRARPSGGRRACAAGCRRRSRAGPCRGRACRRGRARRSQRRTACRRARWSSTGTWSCGQEGEEVSLNTRAFVALADHSTRAGSRAGRRGQDKADAPFAAQGHLEHLAPPAQALEGRLVAALLALEERDAGAHLGALDLPLVAVARVPAVLALEEVERRGERHGRVGRLVGGRRRDGAGRELLLLLLRRHLLLLIARRRLLLLVVVLHLRARGVRVAVALLLLLLVAREREGRGRIPRQHRRGAVARRDVSGMLGRAGQVVRVQFHGHTAAASSLPSRASWSIRRIIRHGAAPPLSRAAQSLQPRAGLARA